MGQAMSSETLSISGGDGYRYWVGLNMKPFGKGCKKTVFKGVLLGSGPRQWEKVIAKAFTDIPGTKEIWSHEVNKADLTRQLAASFLQKHRRICKISVVIPGIVQMDKVSKANNWFANKSGLRGLGRNEWISVEEFIPGQICRFCVWRDEHTQDIKESEHLQTFSHFTYKHSCGTLVACDFQGTCDNKSNPVHYVFTDSIIHSSQKIYGTFDMGEYGITEFFKRHKCNEVCRDWPKPTPLTPPPSFDQACALQLQLTPPPAFENIVFSSQPVPGGEQSHSEAGLDDSWNRRRRHASAHGPRTNRQTVENTLDVVGQPRRRRSLSSIDRGNTLGAPRECIPISPPPSSGKDLSEPPSYSSVCGPISRRRSATFGGIGENEPQKDIFSSGDHQHAQRIAEPQPNRPNNQLHVNNQSSPHQHRGLAITFSDPECHSNRDRTVRPNGNQLPIPPSRSLTGVASHRGAEAQERSVTTTSSNIALSGAQSSISALRRRRMLSQKTPSSEDSDMVSFYLGEHASDLPPLRVVPSAPPPEDSCFPIE
ncbi:alpha-protein kinase vwka [Plakobranchus ocellatus]|uniref:Alpha-protein kinase vwka n=1 Tax=Plakobranchus ocellatus TaxID=259542 RepID=A0AAV4AFT1_9GAST|nr:alpha-protein kinase vwka [Plakobranchus ocellatus]